MNSAKQKTWLWWSSGKDSAWALHCLRRDAKFEVQALVTTVNTSADRVAMHAVRTELLRAQAKALDLPLHIVEIPYPCSNQDYELAAKGVVELAESQGVSHMAFGDLFLEDVRQYRLDLLADSSIEAVFPLWQKDTTELAYEIIEASVCAYLTCIDPKVLDASFAGRRFDQALLSELPEGVDPCGENGEFHSFVYESPDFSESLDVVIGEVVERDGFVFADVLKRAPQQQVISLRRSTAQELELFDQLDRQNHAQRFVFKTGLAKHREYFDDPKITYLTIENDQGEFCGYFMLAEDQQPQTVEFRRIIIEPNQRGVGQAAILEMEKYCKQHFAAQKIWLDVFEDNEIGIHIYEKLGYQSFKQELYDNRILLFYQKRIP